MLMLYREIITLCSEIYIKRVNFLCGEKVGFFKMLNMVVYIVTTGFYRSAREDG